MSIEIRDLRLVQRVAAAGSLTAAAPGLQLTPSALSHQLRSLERTLDTRLFLRVQKRMVLTESGRCLLAGADRALIALQETEQELRRISGGQTGTLRISTACYTSYHWLPRLLQVFQERHPALSVRVLPEFTRRPLDALRQGELDVAVVFHEVEGADLRAETFLEDELVVIAAPRHPLAQRTTIRPEDLADVELFLYSDNPKGSLVMAEILGPAGVSPRSVHAVPLTEAIIELVRGGRGVSVLANWAVAPYLAPDSLVARRLGKKGFRRAWRVVVLQDSPAEEHLPKLIEVLRDAAE